MVRHEGGLPNIAGKVYQRKFLHQSARKRQSCAKKRHAVAKKMVILRRITDELIVSLDLSVKTKIPAHLGLLPPSLS
jgi:hypothetical protein